MITINMDKARNIHKDKMRVAREPLLTALDIQFQRVLEAGSNTTSIVAAKQALRDVTIDQAIDDAQTPDELKAVWPSVLGTSP